MSGITFDDFKALLDPVHVADDSAEARGDRTPSRSDQFFHGTVEHHLATGDVITSVREMTPERRKEVQSSTTEGQFVRGHQNTDRAWATADPMEARNYGGSVYEVTPRSESPNFHRSGHISDPAGLTVKRKLSTIEQIDHPQAHRNRQ